VPVTDKPSRGIIIFDVIVTDDGFRRSAFDLLKPAQQDKIQGAGKHLLAGEQVE
jgi:hypothetical protein